MVAHGGGQGRALLQQRGPLVVMTADRVGRAPTRARNRQVAARCWSPARSPRPGPPSVSSSTPASAAPAAKAARPDSQQRRDHSPRGDSGRWVGQPGSGGVSRSAGVGSCPSSRLNRSVVATLFRSGIVSADADEALDEQHVSPLVVDVALHAPRWPGPPLASVAHRQTIDASPRIAAPHRSGRQPGGAGPSARCRTPGHIEDRTPAGTRPRGSRSNLPGAQLVEVEDVRRRTVPATDGVTGERLCTAQRSAESRQAPPQGTERVLRRTGRARRSTPGETAAARSSGSGRVAPRTGDREPDARRQRHRGSGDARPNESPPALTICRNPAKPTARDDAAHPCDDACEEARAPDPLEAHARSPFRPRRYPQAVEPRRRDITEGECTCPNT